MGSDNSKVKKAKPSIGELVDRAKKSGRLAIVNAKLSTVPNSVWLIEERLVCLDLSNNCLRTISADIGSCRKLQILKLGSNKLTSLPDELYKLEDLKLLSVDENRLQSVAAVLPRKNLRTIDLSHNRFTGSVGHPCLSLPPCVVSANLSFNAISSLNDSFGWESLTYLEELDLDNCELSQLPASFGKLQRLSCLKLRNNQLRTLPPELFKNTKLSRLHLDGNPMKIETLREIEGWELFLARREEQINKGMSQGIHYGLGICGLAE